MSISFLPDILPPLEDGVCFICDGSGIDYNDQHCRTCQGKGRAMVRRWPAEANFANSNAYAVMAALGIEQSPGGSVPHSGLPDILRRALIVLNDDRAASQHTRPAWSVEGGWAGIAIRETGNLSEIVHMGPVIRSTGLDADGLRDRVRSVVEVVEVAHKLGVGITWG